MRRIVLKVDVDTWRGTREGVPALSRLFRKYNAPATFLFSLGPDHTGRAIKRVFRPGFFSKVSRTSVVEHYGLKTLMYGTLLPGPDIGKRQANTLKQVQADGFEVGIHCWDHIAWHDHVRHKNAEWTLKQLNLAKQRFEEVFGHSPQTHGAAGWQMNDEALTWIDAQGMRYASDGRGASPFRPIVAGKALRHIQLPTNLPTLDELIGIDHITVENVHTHVLNITSKPNASQYPCNSFVYTLHAELEGMRLLGTMEKLLQGWQAHGYAFASMKQLYDSIDTTVPAAHTQWGEIAGRSGEMLLQV